MIFNELSRFVSFFVVLQVPFEKAHDILLKLCKEHKLPKTKAHLVMTELKSNQRNTAKMFTEMEKKIWSL